MNHLDGAGPELETERLRLCQFRTSDLDDLYALYSDAQVMRYVGRGVRNREETAEALAGQLEHWRLHGFGMWGLREKGQARLVGRCGLHMLDQTDEIELGYTLERGAWGRGYATEASRASLRFAFEQAGLERIVAVAHPENIASRHVMEKLGMRYEKDAYFYQSNVVYYAITRGEFEGQCLAKSSPL